MNGPHHKALSGLTDKQATVVLFAKFGITYTPLRCPVANYNIIILQYYNQIELSSVRVISTRSCYNAKQTTKTCDVVFRLSAFKRVCLLVCHVLLRLDLLQMK